MQYQIFAFCSFHSFVSAAALYLLHECSRNVSWLIRGNHIKAQRSKIVCSKFVRFFLERAEMPTLSLDEKKGK